MLARPTRSAGHRRSGLPRPAPVSPRSRARLRWHREPDGDAARERPPWRGAGQADRGERALPDRRVRARPRRERGRTVSSRKRHHARRARPIGVSLSSRWAAPSASETATSAASPEQRRRPVRETPGSPASGRVRLRTSARTDEIEPLGAARSPGIERFCGPRGDQPGIRRPSGNGF